jgi:hypothetical protein
MSATPQRMFASALARLHDAEILSRNLETASDAPVLLSILGFEILLKCSLILSNAPAAKTHRYVKLWNALPDSGREEILDVANARMPGHADLSEIEKLLNWYQYIFEKVRYPYEMFEGYSLQEEKDLAELWVSLGAPTEEALIQYYPMELACLIAGVRSYVERRVA